MTDINTITLSGKVNFISPVRKTNTGTPVMDVFVNNKVGNKDTVVKVTMWNEQATYWSSPEKGNLSKGDRVLLMGQLTDDNFEPTPDADKTVGRLKVEHLESFNVIARANETIPSVLVGEEPSSELVDSSFVV